MSNLSTLIGMPEIVAGIMVVALNAYVLMGGADYGGGLWDLIASGPRRAAQRELIAESIAPVWEANHVWLIVVVVMLFTAFPAAFAMLGVVLHVPLTLMLIGIVLRGSSFVFRSYGTQTVASRRRWGRTFAIVSTVTPLLLGDVVGTVTSGAAGAAWTRVDTGTFTSVYIAPWLSAFPLCVGAFALALFVFLAAVYLAYGSADPKLQEDFRRRALFMSIGVFIAAGLSLFLSGSFAPRVMEGVLFSPGGVVLQIGTAITALTAIAALWTRHYAVARLAAVAQVSCILWGWAWSQYPYVIPTSLTIRAAAAPALTLRLLLIGLGGGAVVLLPSLRYLFRTFGNRRPLAR